MFRLAVFVLIFLIVPGFNAQCRETATVLRTGFGSVSGDAAYSVAGDLNSDGIIDGDDLALQALGKPGPRNTDSSTAYLLSHILVKFTPELDADARNRIVHSMGAQVIHPGFKDLTGYVPVAVPVGESIPDFVKRMKSKQEVLAAQPDYICRISSTPDDPFYRYQWNFPQINVPQAWDMSMAGRADVIVAVLDTGVAYEDYGDFLQAPDLSGTRFVAGYDFVNSDAHANDDEGHGTHVAGTIAQTTNNAKGTAGIAYNCSVMPVKILGANGSGSAYGLSQGLRWAVDHGAKVINMSLGFEMGVDPGDIVSDAIDYAYIKGVICVAAAGNDGGKPHYHGGIEFPAAYPHCVAVGATRYDKHRTGYSNWGPELTCVAPGGDNSRDQNHDSQPDGILQQTFNNGEYRKFGYYFSSGTSNACPHVAAAAALFMSRKGGGAAAFFKALQETCMDLGPSGWDAEYGFGLIDIVRLIKKGKGWGANG